MEMTKFQARIRGDRSHQGRCPGHSPPRWAFALGFREPAAHSVRPFPRIARSRVLNVSLLHALYQTPIKYTPRCAKLSLIHGTRRLNPTNQEGPRFQRPKSGANDNLAPFQALILKHPQAYRRGAGIGVATDTGGM
jgi:hypothetical protein